MGGWMNLSKVKQLRNGIIKIENSSISAPALCSYPACHPVPCYNFIHIKVLHRHREQTDRQRETETQKGIRISRL